MISPSRLNRIMAYLYMPLFFTIIGYLIIYVISLPVLDTFLSIGTIVTSSEAPSFDTSLSNIYNEASTQTLDRISLSDVEMPSFGVSYANISCERIGLNTPLYFGDNNTILRSGAGQYIGSSLPGFGKPILLCGHNTTAFLPLQYIAVGDQVAISTNYGTYIYEITETRIAHMNDTSAYDLSQNKEQLILYTCYPFTMLGAKTQRLFVYGDKISGPVLEEFSSAEPL